MMSFVLLGGKPAHFPINTFPAALSLATAGAVNQGALQSPVPVQPTDGSQCPLLLYFN